MSFLPFAVLTRRDGEVRVRKFAGRGVQSAMLVLIVLATVAVGTGIAKDKQPTSKTVSGVVFDNANNPIDGATVELTDLESGIVLDVFAEGGGQYQFTDLSFSHDYKIKATYKGTVSEARQISSIDTRWHPVMNLTIPKAK